MIQHDMPEVLLDPGLCGTPSLTNTDLTTFAGNAVDARCFQAKVILDHVLSSSYFCFSGYFYEQTEEVAMGPPLSSVIAIFIMEDFENVALNRAAFKPTC
jgi:hypothetical protein